MSAPSDTPPRDDVAEAVLYNAECPVCRFEIDRHRDVAAREGLTLDFDDMNGAARDGWGVEADAAARRLHVRTARGVVTGFEANLALWRAMPGWRRLAQVAGLPLVRPVLTAIYDRIFAPMIYRLHLRRQARAAKGGR